MSKVEKVSEKEYKALLNQNVKLRDQFALLSQDHSDQILAIQTKIKLEDERRLEMEAFNNRAAGSRVFLCKNGFGIIQNAMVTNDHKIRFVFKKQKEEVKILFKPVTTYFSIRDYWHQGGFFGKLKMFIIMFWLKILGMSHFGNLKFDLYGIRIGDETTYDLAHDKTPEQIKRIYEEIAKIDKKVMKGNWAALLWEGLNDNMRSVFRMIVAFLISILLIIFMFLIAFGDAIGA